MLSLHFTVLDVMSNEYIKEAIEMMFGNEVLKEHKQIVKILVRFLVCFVYHLDVILKDIQRIPRHKINNINLLSDTNSNFLNKLKEVVTNNQTEGVMTESTDISPFV